eukprot:PhF_6_TR25353/c0_g1_i1/m.35074
MSAITKCLIFLVFHTTLTLSSQTSAIYYGEDGVVILNDTNFDSIVLQEDVMMVKFYAPWCGHCKTLAPEFSMAAQDLKNHLPNPILLGGVDCTKNKKLAKRFNIEHYPTLKVFRKSVREDSEEYTGKWNSQDLVSFMKKNYVDSNVSRGPVRLVNATENDPSPLDFHKYQQCAACLTFASEMHKLMKKRSPPSDLIPNSTKWKKWMSREDRTTEILEDAAQIVNMEYVWVAGQHHMQGQFWLISYVKKLRLLTKKMEETIEFEKSKGGNAGLQNFLKLDIIGNFESLLEKTIQSYSVITVNQTFASLCVKGLKVCPMNVTKTLSVFHPMEEETHRLRLAIVQESERAKIIDSANDL